MSARRLRIAAIAIGLAVVLGPASTAAGGGSGASNVVASGWRLSQDAEGVPRVEFRVAAQIGPGKALGTYEFASVFGTRITGSITCGNVDGEVAVIGGEISSTNVEAFEGGYFFLWLLDNGSQEFGAIGPDQVSSTFVGGGATGEPLDGGSDFPEDFPAHCPGAQGDSFDLLTGQFGLHTVLGSVVVH